MSNQDGKALRAMLGLQFFAEGAEEADGFAEGFADESAEEFEAPEGLEDAATEVQPEEEPETQPEVPEEEPAPAAPSMTAFTVGGRQVAVPADALQSIGRALGADARTILERGMNYESRGAREFDLLDRYAKAGGYADRGAYLDEMERNLVEYRVENELNALEKQYPDSPREALRPIAERTVHSQIEDERNQAGEQARMQAQEAVRRQGEELARPYLEFIRAYPDVDPKSLDKGFFELVNSGLHPQAAYERQQAERAREEAEQLRVQLRANEKNAQNRQRTPGFMAGEELEPDPFLQGFGEE